MEPQASGPLPSARTRLDSWKEIAAYLRRDVRTLQRWEKDEGLPVHRLAHQKQGTVYAVSSELDAWWESRRVKLEASDHRQTVRSTRRIRVRMAAAVAAAVLTIGVWRFWPRMYQASERMTPASSATRLSVALPDGLVLAANDVPAFSPDGHLLAFAATMNDGPRRLWIRALDGIEAQSLPGTDDAALPFFAPSSRSIAFFAHDQLKRIDVPAGAVRVICDLPGRRELIDGGGGTWNAQNVIIFSPSSFGDRLYRVAASGGQATPLTTLDRARKEESHTSPYFLPNGRDYVYTVDSPEKEHRAVYLGSLDSNERSVVIPSLSNVSLASGHLIFARGWTLVAQSFDLRGHARFGELEVLAEDVVRDVNGPSAAFSASLNGRIAYIADPSRGKRQLTWVDRTGRQLDTVGPPGPWTAPALASDAQHLLAAFSDPVAGADLWLFDLPRGMSTRFTSDSEWNSFGRWSPDGSRIVFSSDRTGVMNPYERASDGSRREHQLFVSDRETFVTDWSADGRYLLFQAIDHQTHHLSAEIWPSASTAKPSLLIDSRFNVSGATLSSDMRWLAYASDESGREEIYLQRFPDPDRRTFPLAGRRMLVSKAGGMGPRWRRDGRELFFADRAGNIVVVDIREDSGELRAGVPINLFNTGARDGYAEDRYDIAADGQRFLIARPADTRTGQSIVVLTEWERR